VAQNLLLFLEHKNTNLMKLIFLPAFIFFLLPSFMNAQTASDFYEKAMIYKQKDNYTETWRLLSKAMVLEPTNVKYKHEMANTQYTRKAFYDAIPLYEEMLITDEDNLTILARLAEMYSMSPQKMKGVKYAEQALKMKPQDATINLMLARTFMEVQLYPKAVKLYQEAEKSRPNDKDIPFKIANCYEKMSRNREAVEYFNKAIQLDPDNTTKMYDAAIACINANQSKDAIALLQKAEDRGHFKSKAFYENWAICYANLQEYGRCLEYYAKAKEYAPYDKNLNLDISDTYMAAGQFKKGREVLDEMLEQNADDAEVLYSMGLSYHKEGNSGKADRYFDKAFKLDPSLKSLRYSKMSF
jgi:tetratricopeptide (TPR) repeat protein